MDSPDSRHNKRRRSLVADGNGLEGPPRLAADGMTPNEVFKANEHWLQSGAVTLEDLQGWLNAWRRKVNSQHNASGWAAAPAELLACIFSYLDKLRDLRACSEACASWSAVVWPSVVRLPCEIRRNGVASVADLCPRLEFLRWFDPVEAAVSRLTQLASLAELVLADDTEFPVSIAPVLPRLPALTMLALLKPAGLPECGVLRQLTRLADLSLQSRKDDMSAVLVLPMSLQRLELLGFPNVGSTCLAGLHNLTALTIEVFRAFRYPELSTLTGLRELKLYPREDALINDAIGTTLHALPHLTRLIIDGDEEPGVQLVPPFLCPPGLVELDARRLPLGCVQNTRQLTALRALKTPCNWTTWCPTTLTRLEVSCEDAWPQWDSLLPLQELRELVVGCFGSVGSLLARADVLAQLPHVTHVTLRDDLVDVDDDIAQVEAAFPGIRFEFAWLFEN